MDSDPFETAPTSAPDRTKGPEPAPGGAGRFPYATWGPLGAVGATLLALFTGLLATLPFFALGGLESGEDPEGATAIAAQGVTALGLALIPIVAAWSWSDGLAAGLRALGFRSFRIGQSVAWAAAGIGSYLAFAILYSTLIGQPEQEEIVDRFGPLGFQILLIVVAAPLAEEIAFRGMLFGGLRKKMPLFPAALIGGAFFGLLHFATGWSAVPVLIFLGVVFAVLYEKTKSLWPPILLHAVNNGFALVVLTAS